MRVRKYILPFLGKYHPDEITAPILLPVIRRIEACGTLETAHRVQHNICSQIFRYGIAVGKASRDPAADLRGALQAVPERHFASITDPNALGSLLRAIDIYSGSTVVRTALRMSAYTLSEINFEKAEWRIPKDKMKMKR
jgi:hypothetical protein